MASGKFEFDSRSCGLYATELPYSRIGGRKVRHERYLVLKQENHAANGERSHFGSLVVGKGLSTKIAELEN